MIPEDPEAWDPTSEPWWGSALSHPAQDMKSFVAAVGKIDSVHPVTAHKIDPSTYKVTYNGAIPASKIVGAEVWDAATGGEVIGNLVFDEGTGEQTFKPLKKPQSLFDDVIPTDKVVPSYHHKSVSWDANMKPSQLAVLKKLWDQAGVKPTASDVLDAYFGPAKSLQEEVLESTADGVTAVEFGLEYAQHVVKMTKQWKIDKADIGFSDLSEESKSPHGDYPASWDQPDVDKWNQVKAEIEELIDGKLHVAKEIMHNTKILSGLSSKFESQAVSVLVRILGPHGEVVGYGDTELTWAEGVGVVLAPIDISIIPGATVSSWAVYQPQTWHAMLQGTFPHTEYFVSSGTLKVSWPQKYSLTVTTDPINGTTYEMKPQDGQAGHAKIAADSAIHDFTAYEKKVMSATNLMYLNKGFKNGDMYLNLYLRNANKTVIGHCHGEGYLKDGVLTIKPAEFDIIDHGVATELIVYCSGKQLMQKQVAGSDMMKKGTKITISFAGEYHLGFDQWKVKSPPHDEASLMCSCWDCQGGPPKPNKHEFTLMA